MDHILKDLETPQKVKNPWFECGAKTKVIISTGHMLRKFLHSRCQTSSSPSSGQPQAEEGLVHPTTHGQDPQRHTCSIACNSSDGPSALWRGGSDFLKNNLCLDDSPFLRKNHAQVHRQHRAKTTHRERECKMRERKGAA